MKAPNKIDLWRGRMPPLLGSLALVALLLIVNAVRTFPAVRVQPGALLFTLLQYGFSTVIVVCYAGVGSFVWLHLRERRAAVLLLAFSMLIAACFATQTGAAHNDPLLSSVTSACLTLALPLFSQLLLVVPKNRLTREVGRTVVRVRLARAYVWGSMALGAGLSPLFPLHYLARLPLPSWLLVVPFVYALIVMLAILANIVFTYRGLSSMRERQQWRLFVAGVLVSLLPIVALTVLPQFLGQGRYAVDGRLSALFCILLPLSLGYSLVRYQVVVAERLVKRAVTAILAVALLALLGYASALIVVVCASQSPFAGIVLATGLATGLSPLALWGATAGTRLLFSPETRYYERLLETPHLLVGSSAIPSLEETGDLLMRALAEALQVQEIALCFRASDGQAFRVQTPTWGEQAEQGATAARLRRVLRSLDLASPPPTAQPTTGHDLVLSASLVRLLAQAERPLLAGEVARRIRSSQERRETNVEHGSLLLAPVKVRGDIVGVLALGERPLPQPFAGPDLEVVQLFVARFTPIFATAHAMRALQVAHERQRELDQLRQDFVLTTSHELRTPLTAAQGFLELLADNWDDLDDPLKRSFLEQARRGCQDLAFLANQIMQLAQIDAPQQAALVEELAPWETVQEAVASLDALVQREGRRLAVAVASELRVHADRRCLRQVLLNLLGNALKYSPPGSPISVDAVAAGQEVILRVRDRGNGIPPGEQERIFERFVRLERDINSAVRGSGLGLFISRHLAESMGGKLWVESSGEPGEGSRFCLSLPRACASPQTGTILPSRPGKPTAQVR